ncbi:Mariner Mos1 transposase [Eumeta japonica]|uniref:Mariner Mos1 transposase n=1 Tax=Eumeta variegata TaxID=151549 RepID=A0A4C1SA99_EUMVA|nr:Mariner Mos1 transposase [Eumeta japonica]
MRLGRALKEKRPQYYFRHDKITLLHDNAHPHVAVPVKNYLKTLDWEVLPYPLYPSDIAASDYHLFRPMAHAPPTKEEDLHVTGVFHQRDPPPAALRRTTPADDAGL